MNGHHFSHKFRFLTWFRSKVDKLNCFRCLQKVLNSMLFQGDKNMREMLGEGPFTPGIGNIWITGNLGNTLQTSLHMHHQISCIYIDIMRGRFRVWFFIFKGKGVGFIFLANLKGKLTWKYRENEMGMKRMITRGNNETTINPSTFYKFINNHMESFFLHNLIITRIFMMFLNNSNNYSQVWKAYLKQFDEVKELEQF